MTERGIPEGWSPRDSKPDPASRLSNGVGDTTASQFPNGGSAPKSVPQRQTKNNAPATATPPQKGGFKRRWMNNWALWAVLGALIPGSIAFISFTMLLKLPTAPNCPAIFWPLASASVRLHCAQLAASKQTVNDLLQAIALLESLPADHPLHSQVNGLIEDWAQQILKLADQSFQAGRLDEAIATARKIPDNVSAHKSVEKQITDWQGTWAKAVGFYQEAEVQLRKQHWHDAFMASAHLLNVNNKYWATTKYDQLNMLINVAREDSNKLAKAQSLAKNGVAQDIMTAIKIAQSIASTSYVYQDAQKAIPDFGHKLLDLAQNKLDQHNADEAIAIAREIPKITGMELETEDFINIAEANRSAWMGTVAGLQTAISQAQQIADNRPLHNKAQQLIARWQLEIQDVAHIQRARDLAQQGTIPQLAAAIGEAQLVPRNNPRGQEARKQINQWQGQIETIQDQPYLDRAEQLALMEDANSLQAAITEASQIRSGRALYQTAQTKARTWTRKIQRIQDQPILDQARALASNGDLPAAIAAAKQITSGRALSGDAESVIEDWESQIRARENWRNAQQIALKGTPEAIADAIRLAGRVPRSSQLRNDVNPTIDQWSEQLLSMARSRGEYDVQGGIDIARRIPRGTNAYRAAQEQISIWDKYLNPPAPKIVTTPESTTTDR
jgi:hypothetical protein